MSQNLIRYVLHGPPGCRVSKKDAAGLCPPLPPQGTVQKHACYHHEIFGCQSSIGWKNFFRGHVSKKFQERYLAAGGTKDNWTYNLLKLLWSEIHALWEIRNGFEHGVDTCQKMHKRKQKLLKELQQVYSQRDYMLAIDRDQFYDTPEEHLQHHTRLSQVQSWIKMMRRKVL